MKTDPNIAFNEAFEETRKLVEASKKDFAKRSESEVTHFLIAPLLTNILGWNPFENLSCEYSGEEGSRYDFLLIDKEFRCNLEAKKHKTLEDTYEDEAYKRLIAPGGEEYCIVTDFYQWYFYHKEFKDENGKIVPFLSTNIFEIKESTDKERYSFAKIYFTLRKEKNYLSKFLKASVKLKDGKQIQISRSNKDIFDSLKSFHIFYNTEYKSIFQEESTKKQFSEYMGKTREGVKIAEGVVIKATPDAKLPLEFTITRGGGVILSGIIVNDGENEIDMDTFTILHTQYYKNEYNDMRSVLNKFSDEKTYRVIKTHWSIEGKTFKTLGITS